MVREDAEPVTLLTHVRGEEGYYIAAVTGPAKVTLLEIVEKTNMMGVTKKETFAYKLDFPVKGAISAMIVDPVEARSSSAPRQGSFSERRSPIPIREWKVGVAGATSDPGVGVTQFSYLLGGYTLVVGDSAGGVASYQWFRREDGNKGLRKIYDFTPHAESTAFFEKSLRTKGFISGSENEINVHYGSTGETQLNLTHPDKIPFKAFSMSRKANGVIAADAQGDLLLWSLDNPYPQITLKSVFGKIQYEGYDEPEYVWQSTGGTDAFESKFSLVPLIFGTLKGTFYALLFAVPLAIMGAFYTSQFMHARLKGIVKPTIELMAALPSVVLGFFAALLIAPEVERWLPGILMMPFVVVIVVLGTLLIYEGWDKLNGKIPAGMEISILIPLTLFAGVLSFYLGHVVEVQFLFGDHRTFWQEMFNITYDQRNALVVGLAMGFAVIPMIFTITEDSLSNVPEHLRASSLALGATPWQTAIRVILPTASPGIFSAVMIGFGRAVGETMIVLMATGNTPVMDWSIFNGFRALSANIAVELPEAPEGGTLFRLLFLAAFLLFVMTFFINTVAGGGAPASQEEVPGVMKSHLHGVWRRGDFFIWLSGAGLALSLIMVAALLLAIFFQRDEIFSGPVKTVSILLNDGSKILGQVMVRESIPNPDDPEAPLKYRIQVKKGNRDVYGFDFAWLDDAQIKSIVRSRNAVIVERREWGEFYGTIEEVTDGGKVIAVGHDAGFRAVEELLPDATAAYRKIKKIERKDIGRINHFMEQNRLELKGLAGDGIVEGKKSREARSGIAQAQ